MSKHISDQISRAKDYIRNNSLYKKYLQPYYWTFFKESIDRHPRVKCFGSENPEITFYMVISKSLHKGLFESWFEAAGKYLFSKRKGYVPYIDISVLGTGNPWNDIFSQPQRLYTTHEIYNSKNVLFSDETELQKNIIGNNNPLMRCTPWLINEYRNAFKEIGFNDNVVERLDKLSDKIPSHTIGIPIRRTMEWITEVRHPLFGDYFRHHTRGFMEDYIKYCEQLLDKGSYRYVFVAADDREAVEIMKRNFGDKCIVHERQLTINFIDGKPVALDDPLRLSEFDSKKNYLEREMGYVEETYLLSKCAAILDNGLTQCYMAQVIADRQPLMIDENIYLKMFK